MIEKLKADHHEILYETKEVLTRNFLSEKDKLEEEIVVKSNQLIE
jgi:hypothetical protein